MVVAPRCHGYLHASNKRWLRGSRLLLLGRVKRGSLNSLFLSPRLSSRLHSFSPLSPLSLLSLDNGFEVCCPRCFDRGGIPGRKKGDNRCAFFLWIIRDVTNNLIVWNYMGIGKISGNIVEINRCNDDLEWFKKLERKSIIISLSFLK